MADTQITVSIENLAPENGTNLTPLWVGFHNGGFDLYDRGEAATPGLESLAEDGSAILLGQEFDSSGQGSEEGVVGGAPIAPGAVVSETFTVDSQSESARYFSYASMILPSNDFFVANGNPLENRVFDDLGNFLGGEFYILGSDVLDAGTEVNDEAANSTAFFGQSAPNTGQTEGVVRTASGFIPVEQEGRILADERFANADFTAEGYELARIEVTDDGQGNVTVSITNEAPANGTSLTPLWVGFHNGEFDLYDRGASVTEGLERLAEDGNAAVLGEEFLASGNGQVEGVVGDAPIAPGQTVQRTFSLGSSNASYFSYASMVLPSNDFFVANGNPLAHRIFDQGGNFVGANFTISGDEVLDAGTEISDEVPENTAFFGQSAPNTGLTEGVVQAAQGFIPNGRILSAEEFAAADFTADGYQVAKVTLAGEEAVASTFTTNFSDLANAEVAPNDFQFGKARFTGGTSFFEGVPELYSSGPNAWVAAPGDRLRIDFDEVVSEVSLRAIGLDGGTLRVLGENNQVLQTVDVTGADIRTTETLSFSGQITAVELENTSSAPNNNNFGNYGAAIDDLSYTVAPDAAEPTSVENAPESAPQNTPETAAPQNTVGDADLTNVTVTIDNLSPTNGTNLTPVWVGFHNGEFDLYDRGAPVTPGLESLAEDGSAALLGNEFDASGDGQLDGVVGAAPIAPGARVSRTFGLDGSEADARYFSYASMILPSNDFFVANGNPLAHRVFDEQGNFIGADFFIVGEQVLDAGTEVNDELPESTAFFGQTAPNTGTTENGVVTLAEGFIPNGRILSAAQFAAADFTAEGYQVARVRVTAGGGEARRLEDTNLVELNGNGTALQFSVEQRAANTVNEIIAIATDDAAGTLNGLLPGEEGYLEAVINGAQTVFSALQGNEFGDFNPVRTFDAASGQFLQFGVVQGGSLESLRNGQGGQLALATPAGNADGNSAVNVDILDGGALRLNFQTSSGGSFDDLVVRADFISTAAPVGTALQSSAGLEVFDLRGETDTVQASFELRREAAFDNLVGFYQIENESGQVLASDGVTLLSPGDDGYQEAALQQRLPDVLLGGENNQTLTSETTLSAGQLLAPLLITNGTLDQLLDTDLSNDPTVFFAYTGANSDNAEHVRLLGDNTFGFEDLAGGGDQDFDDIVVRANFS